MLLRQHRNIQWGKQVVSNASVPPFMIQAFLIHLISETLSLFVHDKFRMGDILTSCLLLLLTSNEPLFAHTHILDADFMLCSKDGNEKTNTIIMSRGQWYVSSNRGYENHIVDASTIFSPSAFRLMRPQNKYWNTHQRRRDIVPNYGKSFK